MDSLDDTISCAKEKRKSPIVRSITEIRNNYASEYIPNLITQTTKIKYVRIVV